MTTQDASDRGDGPIVTRLLAFSDGTFAIGLALLVLGLRPPVSSEALAAVVPNLIAYADTFAVVSIFWLAHMSYMRRPRIFGWPTAVINLVLLFGSRTRRSRRRRWATMVAIRMPSTSMAA